METVSPPRRRWFTGMLLVVAFLAMLIYSAWLTIRHADQTLRLILAADQTAFFDEEYETARRNDASRAAQSLDNVLRYYPTGTKQKTGTLLDVVVERARSHAIRELITILRTKTGGDLGDDPQVWIQEYVKSSNRAPPPSTQH